MWGTAILISIGHLLYFVYIQVVHDLIKGIGSYASSRLEVEKLRQYGHTIKIFEGDSPWGFAIGKTIYLNRRLLMSEKALRWVFFHELGHIKHKHYFKLGMCRLFIAAIPMLAVVNIVAAIVVYFVAAYGFYRLLEYFEEQANNYANEKGQYQAET